MKPHPIAMLATALLLSACGGGGGGGGGESAAPQPVTYTFVLPTLGQSQTYTMTETNFDKRSATYGYTEAVTQMPGDGTYQETWTPSQSSLFFDGTSRGFDIEKDTYDNKGQETQYGHYYNGSLDLTCNYAYANGGQPATLTQGQAWVNTVTSSCGSAGTPSTYTANATFLGMESVTVPAGTFNAYKFQYVITTLYPQTAGASNTQTTTEWRNASPTDTRFLKSHFEYTFSGITPQPTDNATIDTVMTSYK